MMTIIWLNCYLKFQIYDRLIPSKLLYDQGNETML